MICHLLKENGKPCGFKAKNRANLAIHQDVIHGIKFGRKKIFSNHPPLADFDVPKEPEKDPIAELEGEIIENMELSTPTKLRWLEKILEFRRKK